MIAAGASANFTKIAEVDRANTPKNKMQYERIGDFTVCPSDTMFIIINLVRYNVQR